MAEKKPSSSVDKKDSRNLLLESLSVLFYISKIFGVIPYSLSNYVTAKQFKLSQLGNIFCILSCVHYVAQYHFLSSSTMLAKDPDNSIAALTMVIGVFIIYLEPLMMTIDVLASLVNQKSLIDIFDRLNQIDDKLEKENILLDYRLIKKYSIIFIAIAFLGEVSLGLYNMVVFQENFFSLASAWWLLSCVPLFCNALAKTWFLVLILVVKQRLRAINDFLNDTKKIFFERKVRHVSAVGTDVKKDNLFIENIGYLEREIFSTRNMKIKSDNAWNWVGNSIVTNKVSGIDAFVPKSKAFIDVVPYEPANRKAGEKQSTLMGSFHLNDHGFLIGDKMDKKLINLCRAHDEICEIAKQVNRMFSFQMLITMAYGFMSITAQFYFFYCGIMQQPIPTIFRTASSIPLTSIFIVYTAYKCVVVIFISWKTKTDSQKTGIQLHKIANVVDENHFYNVCNHLSLKLLNHHLNFTACGFFDLDMATVYAICGAITSYLIILIQFNLAAIRTKPGNATVSATNNGTNYTDAVTVLPFLFTTRSP